MRLGLINLFIFITFFSFSQNFVESKVSINKLEMNTSLSEISCDYFEGDLFYFQNKRVLNRNSQYYDLFRKNVSDEK